MRIVAMDLAEYRRHIDALGFGKILPTAVYLYRDAGASLGAELDQLIARVIAAFEITPEFNVLKFRTDQLKISFLSYPGFFDDAHPALRKCVIVDLTTGKARHTDYASNLNPPILHRKESFLPPDHPRRDEFERLTRQEEEAGLYEKTETIGFKLNWDRLLAERGVIIEGHTLRENQPVPAKEPSSPSSIEVHRHKTAMTRYDLSKPVKTLLEYGLLKAESSFFDYGCGQGADVLGLQALGYQAEGWDPVHRPAVGKREADVVNLGYVLNVIEDPAERIEALVDAFRHARRLLVVSALIQQTVEVETADRLHDGILTKRNTFQKFFEQQELQQYIEDALDSTAVPVSLGIFYVFRNPSDQQDFISARSRRTIDWSQISARLGLGGPQTLWKALYEEHRELLDGFGKLALELRRFPGPGEFTALTEVIDRLGSPKRALRAYVQGGGATGASWDDIRVQFGIGQPPRRRWEILYDEHRELLDSFWNLMLQLGRLPEPEEFPQTGELRAKIGSPKQALRIFIQKGGGDEVKRAAESRKRDLLVYVALANLRKRVPFGHLSLTLRSDIRAFFGNYTRALEKGMDLLYAAGDPGEIELACEGLKLGWQDEQALYVHRSLVDQLPPVLRAYVGCATALFGDVSQADVLKLHKASGKVTFLAYDDFEGKPLPELRTRIKVNLRTRWVQVFDHSTEGQLLYHKERLLPADHP
ncbi:MAG TPA: DNA phosphorothioation-associated putative methyltransferase [Candidatus Paceibacterota bacterium]|nr:DNA phosphorothioation-associated putative methyltransferase [Candidatus Paceibacterota bacterium]HSA03246.1 DNA phosphorothioation-associated putative methyltransferase [Candidatus Paceibacterota bacterium]